MCVARSNWVLSGYGNHNLNFANISGCCNSISVSHIAANAGIVDVRCGIQHIVHQTLSAVGQNFTCPFWATGGMQLGQYLWSGTDRSQQVFAGEHSYVSCSAPTSSPSILPSMRPTQSPTNLPTPSPSREPTGSPSGSPTSSPSMRPTQFPTSNPTPSPSRGPTRSPSDLPTSTPSMRPTQSPITFSPTQQPTTGTPSTRPTSHPTYSPTAAPTVTPPCEGGRTWLTPERFRSLGGSIGGEVESCCSIAALSRRNLTTPLTVNCGSTLAGQLTQVGNAVSCPVNTEISVVDTSGSLSNYSDAFVGGAPIGIVYFVNPTLCKFPTLTFLHPLIDMDEFNQNGQQVDWTLSGAFGTRAYFPRLDSKYGARIRMTSKTSGGGVADVYCNDADSSQYSPGKLRNVDDEVVCGAGARVSVQQYAYASRGDTKMRGSFTVFEPSSASTWIPSASKIISLAGFVALFNLL